MTKAEQFKGDRLIAEFMGGKLIPSSHLFKYWIWTEGYNPDFQVRFMENKLLFSESFDWLMAALTKIEKMGYQNSIEYLPESKEHKICIPKASIEVTMNDKKQALWWAVVEWIEWLESNKYIDLLYNGNNNNNKPNES